VAMGRDESSLELPWSAVGRFIPGRLGCGSPQPDFGAKMNLGPPAMDANDCYVGPLKRRAPSTDLIGKTGDDFATKKTSAWPPSCVNGWPR
jgi:hypothetical protein